MPREKIKRVDSGTERQVLRILTQMGQESRKVVHECANRRIIRERFQAIMNVRKALDTLDVEVQIAVAYPHGTKRPQARTFYRHFMAIWLEKNSAVKLKKGRTWHDTVKLNEDILRVWVNDGSPLTAVGQLIGAPEVQSVPRVAQLRELGIEDLTE